VALYLVFAYTMLEVSNAILIADTIKAYAGEGFGDWHYKGIIASVIVGLAALNYRGVLMTLNVNFVITAIAYAAIIILFFSVQPWSQGTVLKLNEMVASSRRSTGASGTISALRARPRLRKRCARRRGHCLTAPWQA
jgi:ethanolamine permease